MMKNDHIKRMPRYKIPGDRPCSFELLETESQKWIKHAVRLVDISMTGVGIESDQPVDTGLVWFKDCLSGFQCGIVVWCREEGPRYRAGIQFVGLNREDKECLRRQIEHALTGEPSNNPIGIRQLVERILKNRI